MAFSKPETVNSNIIGAAQFLLQCFSSVKPKTNKSDSQLTGGVRQSNENDIRPTQPPTGSTKVQASKQTKPHRSNTARYELAPPPAWQLTTNQPTNPTNQPTNQHTWTFKMRSFSAVILMAVIAVMALLLLDEATASCANACSGHGSCGDFDSCACQTNWQGADCSLRTCPHHLSWATTSKGDLNFDGDTNDATVYDNTTKFADSGVNYVATQSNAGGDWEGWPSTINALGYDEGHYYMECANRGTCDRKLGLCKCFEGYTGAACQRTTCPEACNARGVCKSVLDQAAVGVPYTLWDGSMSHSCVCDKGFTGPSCADRACPVGDDPLTTDQQFETQWVEIYSPRVATKVLDFTGSIRLTYTDVHSETYETDDINVLPYEGTDTGTTTAFAAALNRLPNHQLSGVTVEEGWCQTAMPGTFKVDTDQVLNNGIDSPATYYPEGEIARCDYADDVEASTKLLPQGTSASRTAIKDIDEVVFSGIITDASDVICYTLTDYYCNRYKVTFASTPGDHADLIVDTSDVVVDGKTTAAGAAGITATVSDTLQLGYHDSSGIELSFMGLDHPDTKSTVCNSCSITGQNITLLDASEGDKYEAGERIVVTCDGVAWGTFTVKSVTSDVVAVTENIKQCTEDVAVSLASYVITTNTRLDGILSIGDRLIVDSFASVPPTISAFSWNELLDPPGRIFLSEEYVGSTTLETTTAGTHYVSQYGTGTTENNVCSDRGVCIAETGECNCFKGYTGLACSTQNALSG